MNPKILVVGDSDADLTLLAVKSALEADFGADVIVVDGALVGSMVQTSIVINECTAVGSFISSRESVLNDCGAVWYRRWHEPDVIAASERPRFSELNWGEFIEGLSYLLPKGRLNDPLKHRLATNKVLQLQLARAMRLRIPDTLITSDEYGAQAFFEKHSGNIVAKGLCNEPGQPSTETVALTLAHLKALPSLGLAPVIFQERIPVRRDIRVTLVGTRIFAAEVDTAAGRSPVDWRLDVDNRWIAHELPVEIQTAMHDMATALGLGYFAADLRLTPDGEYVFFEINPGGQFMFIEVWTGLPIAAAVAAELVNLARAA